MHDIWPSKRSMSGENGQSGQSGHWPCGPRRHGGRQGLATLEFALCLPLLVTIFLGTLDTCQVIFYQQAIDIAVHEGAVAAANGATTGEVVLRCQQVLNHKGIDDAVVSTTPDEVSTASPRATIRVDIELPCDDLTFFGPFHRACTLKKHFVFRKGNRWEQGNGMLDDLPNELSLQPKQLSELLSPLPLPLGGVN